MRSIRVILTCIGGRFGLNIIRALQQCDNPRVVVVGTDMDRNIIARHFVKSFYTLPHGSESNYIPEMLRICKKEKIRIIIPGSDEEVMAISKAKDVFDNEGVACAVDNEENVSLVTDRWKLYNHLSSNGITMPRYKLVQKFEDVARIVDYFEYPKMKFVVKPRRSRGARNVWVIGEDRESTSLKDFRYYFNKVNANRADYVAMEFLPGPAYDVDVISNEGKPICIIPRRRIWKNKLSASSEGCLIERNTRLIQLASRIAKLLNLNYAYDFDCGSFSDSAYAIYEINPRISGAVTASLGAGVNVPAMLVKMLTGVKLPKINIKFNVAMFPVADMIFLDKGKVFYANKGAK